MIFEAIAVVQTANTAIGAVKELLKNGKDITDCAAQLGQYFDAKAEIQRKSGSKQSTGSDLENFLHKPNTPNTCLLYTSDAADE